MKFLNSMGLFVVNGGGPYFTFTFQPWKWVRVYLFGKVFNWGHYVQKEHRIEREINYEMAGPIGIPIKNLVACPKTKKSHDGSQSVEWCEDCHDYKKCEVWK